MANLVSHPATRETFEYLAKEAEENNGQLRQCLTPESCPMIPPVHDLHLAEHLKVPVITEDLSPKDTLALAIKRSEALSHFYQSMAELQPPGEIRGRLEYLVETELSHREKLENLKTYYTQAVKFYEFKTWERLSALPCFSGGKGEGR